MLFHAIPDVSHGWHSLCVNGILVSRGRGSNAMRPRAYLGLALEPRRHGTARETVHLSERSPKMRPSEFLHRTWGRHENRRQSRAGTWPRYLMLETLEDRTVPSTASVLGNIAPALHNLSSITSALAAPAPGPGGAATNPTLASAASALSGVSSGLQNLVTDLTKTLQSVITDLTDTIKLVGDTANSALSGVTNILTTDVADLKTLLTDVTTTVTNVTATIGDVVTALTSGLTGALNSGVVSTLNGVSSSL